MAPKYINFLQLVSLCDELDFELNPERMKSWFDRTLVRGFYVGDQFYFDINGFMPPQISEENDGLFSPGEWYANEDIMHKTGLTRQGIWRKIRFHNLNYKMSEKFHRKIYRGDELNAIFKGKKSE